MKPLPIKEQIKVLRKLLFTPFIYGMCVNLFRILKSDYFVDIYIAIPSFNHLDYLLFYPKVKAVQKRIEEPYWDNCTIFGNLRRRWFIRHLIKELKKQLGSR